MDLLRHDRLERRAITPLLVFAAGIAMTLALALLVYRMAETRDESRFTRAVQATEDRISARLELYIALMRATRALFAAHESVDTATFHRYAAQLDLPNAYPGIQGIGFARRVDMRDRAALETEMRAHGLPDFRVWPTHEGAEGTAIVMLEPQDARNRAAIGFDMFSETVRREAMERARDTGTATATGRVTLVQEIDAHKQAGFLVYVPVYAGGQTPATVDERRRALLGFVYAPFRAGDLFARIFGREQHDPRTGFAVYDERVGDETLLYTAARPDTSPEHETTKSIEVAGRRWRIRHWALPAFHQGGSSTWAIALVVLAGCVGSVLLALLARARTRADHELRLRSRILDSMTEGVSVTDERGIILYTNPAEDRMFGYGPGELIGKPVTVQNRYPPEENQRIFDGIIAELRERGSWSGELSNVTKDGRPFTTHARIAALDLATTSLWVCVQEDVTDRKRADEERAALLERERAANRTKDEFLAMLGHELRNPLAPIVTALELVDQRYGRDKFPEVNVIDRQVRHLRRMVDDLLDVSAIARGKVSLRTHRLELRPVIDAAIELAAPLLEERRHQLVVDVPESGLPLDGDDARLVQIFSNLLTNAAKYTDAGGRVEVSAAAEGDVIRVTVRDTGIGIERDDLESIFELFAQAERRVERSRGGLGIGLSLARSLVALHGGSIHAASEGRGKGTEITVRLPRSAQSDVAAIPETIAPAAHAGRARRRLLVVDDNADAADMLGELLRAAGHDVDVAYDGPQALSIAERSPPDVAILDIGLPVMDGYELGTQLSSKYDLKLIALTGYGRDHDRQRSASAGFAAHLVKPVSPAQLLELID